MNGIVSNTVNAMKKEKGDAVTNVLTLTTLHSNNNVNISNNSNGNNNSTAYNDNTCKETYPGLFNKIVLTSENSLIPKEKLNATPSSLYGLDQETEMDLRILGCELIQTAGILLRLPQVAMATGQVLFQRFFYAKSFVHHNIATVAMSCVTLASKIEETPRCIRDVINVFHHMKQVRTPTEITPLVLDKHYTDLKTEVIKEERRVLKELGFCVHAKHPHKLIVMYLKVLQHEEHAPLMQFSWNFMNDSLRTDVFMRFTPESIACACIYLGARKLNIPLPQSPPWFGLFKVSAANITDICYRIMELYTRAKPNAELLDSTVKNLKRRYIDARNLNKKSNLSLPLTAVDSNDRSHDGAKGNARLVNSTHSKRSHCDWDDYRARERYRNRGWNLARSGARARSPTKDEKKNIKLFAHSSSMPSKNCK